MCLQKILENVIEVQLMGFAMGNAWISPIDSTLTWGPLLYWMVITSAINYWMVILSVILDDNT